MMTDITLVAAEVLALFCMMLVGVAARLAGILTKDSTRLLSSLLVFLAPLILLAAEIGVCYACDVEELIILLICVGTIALWFLALAFIDKGLARVRGFCPAIIKIIEKEQEKGEEENERTD